MPVKPSKIAVKIAITIQRAEIPKPKPNPNLNASQIEIVGFFSSICFIFVFDLSP